MANYYNALDVSRFIINYSNKKKYGISNLKLQKVLYFVQAYFLVVNKKPCFNENIEAWDFGPVVPKAYHEYEGYGSNNLPSIKTYFDFTSPGAWRGFQKTYDKNIIAENDRINIAGMVDALSYYSSPDLVKITYNQDPWRKNYVPYMNKTINNSDIEHYFMNV